MNHPLTRCEKYFVNFADGESLSTLTSGSGSNSKSKQFPIIQIVGYLLPDWQFPINEISKNTSEEPLTSDGSSESNIIAYIAFLTNRFKK